MVNKDYSEELILIVDDDINLCETLEKLIGLIGMAVESASNTSKALEIIEEKDVTIVLTDMKMPDMDGVDFVKMLNERFDVSIIAMTGFPDGYSYVDVINAGASDFIKKPFGIEELEAKIRRIITERDLRRELNRLSITDSLTELYNQRHFYKRFNEEAVRAERQGRPISLILLDIDDFKKYNDKYGHLAGDEVLRKAGEIIRSCIRENVDSGYRYGGDEFAVILIEADLDIAKEIGQRIQRAFKKDGKVTVTIGYSKLKKGMGVEDIVSKADVELFERKKELKSG
jgi:two-component system cell cycle response regulator